MSYESTRASQRTSQTPLSQAPVFLPPTADSRNTSPLRKPLHERSSSENNQHLGPTIRIVNDPGATDIYDKYPIPSEPSQILPPPRHAPGYGFERPGSRVSSGSKVASTVAKFEASRTLEPQPQRHRKTKSVRNSGSTRTSDADTIVAASFSPSSLRFSQASTPPLSPGTEGNDLGKGLRVLEETHPAERPTIRAVPPSSSGGDSLESRTRALTPEASAAPFASSPHTTPLPTKSNAADSSGSHRPLESGHKHSQSAGSQEGRPSLSGNSDHQQSVLRKPSVDSFAYSDISYTSIEPTYIHTPDQSSLILHEAQTATFASGIRINYPVIRVPSTNSSRADSYNSPNIATRMQDRSLEHQWSSQLSTIPSVSERDSRSLARNSRSLGARSQSQDSYTGHVRTSFTRRRGHTVSSAQTSSDNVSSEGQTEFSAVPRPLFSPVSRASSEDKDSNGEHLDTISPLPSSVPLRMKNSGYLRRHNSDSGSTTDSRPGSSHSDISTFIHNNIPAWARVYYQRGERISGGAPESESSGSIRGGTSYSARSNTPSETHFPLSIYRPRNRPRNRQSQPDTVSLSGESQQAGSEIYVVHSNNYPASGWSTPHLHTDRRGGQAIYSAWNPPSLDDDLNTTLFGRQNRQILLFCIGFIFPLGKHQPWSVGP